MVLERVMAAPVALPEVEESLWPEQEEWTYEDYLRLPDDGKRYEIIEGVLYVTNAPSYAHQFVVSELHLQIGNFVKVNQLGVVITAPFEVHLPGIARPVQPDVLFISAERMPDSGAGFFEGPPDLIVEVLSPSSIRTDRFVKFDAYERAGVREYWIADPGTRSVEVFILPGREYALLGQFRANETLKSDLLPGLEISVKSLFVERGSVD